MAARPLGAPPAGLCEDARARASLALDGELDDEVGARLLRRHLAGCPDCASRVAEMWAITGLLRQAPLEPVPRATKAGLPQPADPAAARPALRPEKRQPPRNVPSRERYPCMPPPPKPAASPAA